MLKELIVVGRLVVFVVLVSSVLEVVVAVDVNI